MLIIQIPVLLYRGSAFCLGGVPTVWEEYLLSRGRSFSKWWATIIYWSYASLASMLNLIFDIIMMISIFIVFKNLYQNCLGPWGRIIIQMVWQPSLAFNCIPLARPCTSKSILNRESDDFSPLWVFNIKGSASVMSPREESLFKWWATIINLSWESFQYHLHRAVNHLQLRKEIPNEK